MKGTKNILALSTLMTMGGATTSSINNFLLGKEVSVEDVIVNSLLKIGGLSSYTLTEGKPSAILMDLFMPPAASGLDALYTDLTTTGEQLKTLKSLPPFGDYLYMYWGGGIEHFQELEKKKGE